MPDRETGLRFGNGTGVRTMHYQMEHEKAPNADWSQVNSGEHFVQFYNDDRFIVDAVAEYFIHGLRSGGTCIVAATGMHLSQIERRILSYGIELESYRTTGKYIELDAEEALAMIMVDGLPDAVLFSEVIGKTVAGAARNNGDVRVFGELVNVLSTRENYAAAGSLENMWNRLRKDHHFSLFCAYATAGFKDDAPIERMLDICSSHSHVIPDETYTSINNTNDRLRKIATLQQRIKQLELELLR